MVSVFDFVHLDWISSNISFYRQTNDKKGHLWYNTDWKLVGMFKTTKFWCDGCGELPQLEGQGLAKTAKMAKLEKVAKKRLIAKLIIVSNRNFVICLICFSCLNVGFAWAKQFNQNVTLNIKSWKSGLFQNHKMRKLFWNWLKLYLLLVISKIPIIDSHI